MDEKMKTALDQVFEDLRKMSPEEFDDTLKKATERTDRIFTEGMFETRPRCLCPPPRCPFCGGKK